MLFVSPVLHEWREGSKLGPADEQFLCPAIFPTATPVATNVRTKVDIPWKGKTTLMTTTEIEAHYDRYTHKSDCASPNLPMLTAGISSEHFLDPQR